MPSQIIYPRQMYEADGDPETVSTLQMKSTPLDKGTISHILKLEISMQLDQQISFNVPME